jgi:hypothetical protein
MICRLMVAVPLQADRKRRFAACGNRLLTVGGRLRRNGTSSVTRRVSNLAVATRIRRFVRKIASACFLPRLKRGVKNGLADKETLGPACAKIARSFPNGGRIFLRGGWDYLFVRVWAGKREHRLFVRHDNVVIEPGVTATIEIIEGGPRSRAEEALFGGPPRPCALIEIRLHEG